MDVTDDSLTTLTAFMISGERESGQPPDTFDWMMDAVDLGNDGSARMKGGSA